MLYGIDLGLLWLLWLGFIVFWCCWAAHDDAGWAMAFVLAIGTTTFLLFAPPANAALQWAINHGSQLPYLVLLYVAVGLGWGIVKWYLFVSQAARNYAGRAADLMRNYQAGPWSPSGPSAASSTTKITYAEWLSRFHDLPPSHSKNRSRIVTWMVWWPFSFLDTLLSDLVRRIFDAIYDEVAALLGRISARVFHRFEELR